MCHLNLILLLLLSWCLLREQYSCWQALKIGSRNAYWIDQYNTKGENWSPLALIPLHFLYISRWLIVLKKGKSWCHRRMGRFRRFGSQSFLVLGIMPLALSFVLIEPEDCIFCSCFFSPKINFFLMGHLTNFDIIYISKTYKRKIQGATFFFNIRFVL